MAPDSDEELAQIVTTLADDRDATTEMGLDARRFVLEHYSRDDLAAAYLDLLHSVAGLPCGESSTNEENVADEISSSAVWPVIWRQEEGNGRKTLPENRVGLPALPPRSSV